MDTPGKYSVVVLDVDGTMVGADFKVSVRLREAVQSAKKTGATVSLATGRMMRSALTFAEVSGAAGPLICYQGAMTLLPGTQEVLRHERLDPGTANSAVDLIRSSGATPVVYVEDEIYVEDATPWAEGYALRMDTELRLTPSLAEVANQHPTLVLGVDHSKGIDKLVTTLSVDLDGRAMVTHSLAHFCEVGSARAGKHMALDHLSKWLGVERERFVAFGDGAGDAAMLEWAGLGICVEDGHPAALMAADQVVPGPDKHGVAKSIEALLEQGKLGA